jgi:hypothetical protein
MLQVYQFRDATRFSAAGRSCERLRKSTEPSRTHPLEPSWNRLLGLGLPPFSPHNFVEGSFELTQEADGGFVAESLGDCVITQADMNCGTIFEKPPKPISSTARRRNSSDFTSYVTKCSGPDETARSVGGLGTGDL